jgi:hypothetical protein
MDILHAGQPDFQEQQQIPRREAWTECPKYNWRSMDEWERLSVGIGNAVGYKNFIISGSFGVVLFIIFVLFFREQLKDMVIEKFLRRK